MSEDSNELPPSSEGQGSGGDEPKTESTAEVTPSAEDVAKESANKKESLRKKFANAMRGYSKSFGKGDSQMVKRAEEEAKKKQDDSNPIRANLAKFELLLTKALEKSISLTLYVGAKIFDKKEKNEDKENKEATNPEGVVDESPDPPNDDEPHVEVVDDFGEEGIELGEISPSTSTVNLTQPSTTGTVEELHDDESHDLPDDNEPRVEVVDDFGEEGIELKEISPSTSTVNLTRPSTTETVSESLHEGEEPVVDPQHKKDDDEPDHSDGLTDPGDESEDDHPLKLN